MEYPNYVQLEPQYYEYYIIPNTKQTQPPRQYTDAKKPGACPWITTCANAHTTPRHASNSQSKNEPEKPQHMQTIRESAHACSGDGYAQLNPINIPRDSQ